MAMFEEQTAQFLSWFKNLDGSTFSDAIDIADFRGRKAGRGIVATKDIPADTVLFTIPRKSIINVETSALKGLLPQVLEEPEDDETPHLDSWSSLILIMMYEYMLGAESAWKSYFDVLPSSFDTPMFWSTDELSHLQASATAAKVGKDTAEEMFKTLLIPAIRSYPQVFAAAQNASDDDLITLAHRMGSTIMAYAFDLENDEEDEDEDGWVEDRDGKALMGMVPMADIMNADAEFNAHVNHEDDALTVTSLREIKAGQEVLNYYGPHPNSELLRRYGYTSEKHARYDIVELPWSIVENFTAVQLGLSAAETKQVRESFEEDELEDSFVLEREAAEVGPDGTFAGPAVFTEMPDDLTDQLKQFLKATKQIKQDLITDKRKRDEAQSAILLHAVEALQATYPTSVQQDQELLANSQDIPDRRRMAIIVRLGEKMLLKEVNAYLTAKANEPNGGLSNKRARLE